MTADDLRAFITSVRTEVDAALAHLETVDRAALTPELRAEYDAVRKGWETLRRMADDDVVALHEAACLRAGRELTPDELRGLLGLQSVRSSLPSGIANPQLIAGEPDRHRTAVISPRGSPPLRRAGKAAARASSSPCCFSSRAPSRRSRWLIAARRAARWGPGPQSVAPPVLVHCGGLR